MAQRVRHLAPVTLALALAAAGCATPVSGVGTPPGTASVQRVSSATPRSRERVRSKEFSDLASYPPYYFPTALTVGPDKALWVTDDIDQDAGQSAVVHVAPSGKFIGAFDYANGASPSFEGITTGPDGALWMTDSGDQLIVRMTPQGAFTTYFLPYEQPQSITVGPDKALWFTEGGFETVAIGRITTSGKISTYQRGINQSASLAGITPGPDGALWFTESVGDRIGRITTHGKVTEYAQGITPQSRPYSIAAGPDGALWFTEQGGGRIGRITTSGTVTEYSHGISQFEQPTGITAGPDGAMWFTEYIGYSYQDPAESKIGRITTQGVITEYSSISSDAAPAQIIEGAKGDLWFVEAHLNRLGRLRIL